MALARSKITSQGQLSVPAAVRKELGIGPGSTVEWEVKDGKWILHRSATYTFADIRKHLFPDGPPKKRTNAQLKESIAEYVREKYGDHKGTSRAKR